MFKYLDFTEVSQLIIKSKNVDDSSLGYLKKSVLDFIRQSEIEPCFYYKGYLRAIIKGNFSSTIDEARFLFEGYIRPPTGIVRKVFSEYNDYRECPWNKLLGNFNADADSLYIQKVNIVEVVDLQEQHDDDYLNRKRKPFDFDRANELYIEPQTYIYEEMYFYKIDVGNFFNLEYQTSHEGLAQKLIEAKIKIEHLKIQLAQAEVELEDNSVDDEPTHHKSVGSMQALVTTLIKMAEYDKEHLADPYGELNKLIQAKAEGLGLSVKKDFIAKWLKKADDVL
ncbi:MULTISPECIES: hypothetical protein [unclassified Psychrobacter]|uniref:hypothetical protein n=1 Tax=unclassified Psychrobacter TaxID=196806 RepID=UPI0025B2E775|nr:MULTISPECIES: hypothetical protein [unclassified Psychrobacter]MDN3452235.1 hypothetical protein [Psychrobacter sp. APC 3350]MDN3502611.1 hypothetical protein [Psychrobacter sp. 5A.1]